MHLLISRDKALDILNKRIEDLSSEDFSADVWKNRTSQYLSLIFSDTKAMELEVSEIRFRPKYTSAVANEAGQRRAKERLELVMMAGKRQALHLIQSYIDLIEHHISEVDYRVEYETLKAKCDELESSTAKIAAKMKELMVIYDGKDKEIERLSKENIDLEKISLRKLLGHLNVGQMAGVLGTLAALFIGGYSIGTWDAKGDSKLEQYDLKVERDTYKRRVDSLMKVKAEIPYDSLINPGFGSALPKYNNSKDEKDTIKKVPIQNPSKK